MTADTSSFRQHPVPSLSELTHGSPGAPVGVLAALDQAIERNIERGAAKGSPSDRGLREARAAMAELIEQQKRDAQLVPVLMSYLRDYLPPREMERLNRELLNRGLDNQHITRAAALARVQGGA